MFYCCNFIISLLATSLSNTISLHTSLPSLNCLHYVMTLRHLLLLPPPQYNPEETNFMTILWLTLFLSPRLTSVEKHATDVSYFKEGTANGTTASSCGALQSLPIHSSLFSNSGVVERTSHTYRRRIFLIS